MATARGIRLRRLLHVPVCVLALGASLQCFAAALAVNVLDERGQPIDSVAVYAMPSERPPRAAGTAAFAAQPTAIMDQANNAFVPHLLVVQTGTSVLFPNNDSVSHHVYSFSEAKTFELGLYKGDAYPPVRFETPGVVVLGCNIHDSMLGYIVVVDTPHFALTDDHGAATLHGLAPGEYTVEIWSPRARPSSLPAGSRVAVASAGKMAVTFRLQGKLLPAHDHGETGLSWERY